MAAIYEDGKLRLSGIVGGDYYFEDGFNSADVVMAIASLEADAALTVFINSPGGIATEGAAIHAVLKQRPGRTDVVVEGIAASAASLIAMVGETVTMSAGSIMMIHDPSSFTFGTSDEHSKTVEQLEALATSYARVYAAKTGRTAAECRDIMKRETWLTPDQAVAEGFADDTSETRAAPVAAFDYRLFTNPPKRLSALAKAKNWTLPATAKVADPKPSTPKAAPSAASPGQQETTMSEQAMADDARKQGATSMKDRIKAIMTCDEAKGRAPLAEHLAYDTDMDVEAAKKVLAAAGSTSEPTADPAQPDPQAYAQMRTAGAGLGGGQPPTGKGDRSPLAAAVDRYNARR